MKPKLLLLLTRPPYPLIGGDRIKNYNLIRILSTYFQLYIVIVTSDPVPEEAIRFLNSYSVHFKIFQKPLPFFILNSFKSFINRKPLQVNYYFFKEVKQYISKLVEKEGIKIGISTLVRTTEYLKDIPIIKIFDMADSIGQNYQKSVTKVKSPFWKAIYYLESERLLHYEKEMIDRFDLTFMFNPEEIKYFNSPKVKFIPHGVNPRLLSYEKTNPAYQNVISFFGKMDYQPNVDAVLWFSEKVLPLLPSDLKFFIIGANPTKKVKKLAKKYQNVVVTGFVEDPYEILKSSLCVVSPMQTGGGIQNKVLESMALGTINILSSIAARPIGAKNGEEYLVIDHPEQMGEEICKIWKNPSLYSHFRQKSRDFIARNFTWERYEEILIQNLFELIEKEKNDSEI